MAALVQGGIPCHLSAQRWRLAPHHRLGPTRRPAWRHGVPSQRPRVVGRAHLMGVVIPLMVRFVSQHCVRVAGDAEAALEHPAATRARGTVVRSPDRKALPTAPNASSSATAIGLQLMHMLSPLVGPSAVIGYELLKGGEWACRAPVVGEHAPADAHPRASVHRAAPRLNRSDACRSLVVVRKVALGTGRRRGRVVAVEDDADRHGAPMVREVALEWRRAADEPRG